MGDEKVCQVHLFLQLLQEIDDLRLNRNIQRGDRLVADNKFGGHGQSAGNTDALALPAAKLVRITVVMIFAEAHLPEQFDHPVALGSAPGEFVNFQAFSDDIADAHPRVQRSIGILKNDLHLPPRIAEFALGQSQQVFSLEINFAAGRLDEPKNGSSQCRLAAAGFADDAQGFAFLHAQTTPSTALTALIARE
jgi:hypothetical protein